MPKVILFIAAGMLFIGVLPLPYGYYMLLRCQVPIDHKPLPAMESEAKSGSPQ
ncbi:DUF6804 family protein [Thiolapillus sp.]|uniref:DUF6804 family protein n=1 Tax=Thiolapillus sp. TaxID=2017437 RepID=UPI003AF508CC